MDLIESGEARMDLADSDGLVVLTLDPSTGLTRRVQLLANGRPVVWVDGSDKPGGFGSDWPTAAKVAVSLPIQVGDVLRIRRALAQLTIERPLWLVDSPAFLTILGGQVSGSVIRTESEGPSSRDARAVARDRALSEMAVGELSADNSSPLMAPGLSRSGPASLAEGGWSASSLDSGTSFGSEHLSVSESRALGNLLISGLLRDGRVEGLAREVLGLGAKSERLIAVAERILVEFEGPEHNRSGLEAELTDTAAIAQMRRARLRRVRRGGGLETPAPVYPAARKVVQAQWLVAQARFVWTPWPGELLPLVERTAVEFHWSAGEAADTLDAIRRRYEQFGNPKPTFFRGLLRRLRPYVIPTAKAVDGFLLRHGFHRTRRLMLRIGRKVLQR